jgi:hypothetical protein
MTFFLTAGCSSGGSSGGGVVSSGGGGDSGGSGAAVTGLTVASKVSVVDAQQTASPSRFASALIKLAALSSVPASSDYSTDKTNVYVNEKAGDAFQTVNMILCMVDQTKYAEMVNKGYYKAMINSDVCQGNDSAANSGSSSQGGTSGSAAPSYDTWTVKSERSTESSPEVLTAYVHMAKGGPANQQMTVQAVMTITEGTSGANPIGIFSMNYKGFMDSDPATVVMKGILKTERDQSNRVVIKFAEKEFSPDGIVVRQAKAAYVKDDTAGTGQGSASIFDIQAQPQQSGINFAYNGSYFKRVDPANGQGPCLDRKSFETSAWRYGLYDSVAGSRATLNAGFPINTNADGSGFFGYLGYYGLNLPPDAPALTDGATVYKQIWDKGTAATTPYTIFIRGGKLKKHTRSLITLKEIKNIPLEGGIPQPGSTSPGNVMYRLTWGDDGKLAIRAQALMDPSGPPAWQDLNPATSVESLTLPWNNLSLYSQALGGQVNIELSGCQPVDQNNPGAGFACAAPTGDTPVVFYAENIVYPLETVPSPLSCYDNCPKAGSSGMDPADMTYMMSFDPTADNRHDYTFADMVLKDNGNSVILASASAGQPSGFGSGALFSPATVDAASGKTYQELLACDWDPNQTCGWKAWSVLPQFYTWETGPNSWNRFSAAKDANGAFVKFDPPWQVEYTYPSGGTSGINSAATDLKYGGTRFFFQYSGFGDLNGIPGKCVNPNDPSQTPTDCSQPGLRWVPEFTIPAGSTVMAGDTAYLLKPLEIEQRMSKSPGMCTDLTPTDMTSDMPNIDTDWVDPALPTEPAVTAPPNVIGGVVQ